MAGALDHIVPPSPCTHAGWSGADPSRQVRRASITCGTLALQFVDERGRPVANAFGLVLGPAVRSGRCAPTRRVPTGAVAAGVLPVALRDGTAIPGDKGAEIVADASAVLVCTIGQPCCEVMERELYAVDCLGHKFLTTPDAVEKAANYPRLVDVSFSHVHTVNGFISRWRPTVRSGVEASASFEVDEGPRKQGGHWIVGGASSGLDPERTWAVVAAATSRRCRRG